MIRTCCFDSSEHQILMCQTKIGTKSTEFEHYIAKDVSVTIITREYFLSFRNDTFAIETHLTLHFEANNKPDICCTLCAVHTHFFRWKHRVVFEYHGFEVIKTV